MIYGFRHQGGYEIPAWADKLKFYYFVIRLEGRDKSKRRRYYRYIAAEKLRLAEQQINQASICAVCRYLCDLKPASAKTLHHALINSDRQLQLF